MKIGELARLTNTQTETIRYYEREGLLPPAARTDANYRVYTEEHGQRLSFIRHCRSLDMTLDEIRTLLHFKDSPQENCQSVNMLLDEHIDHVARRIRELRRLQKDLNELREHCRQSSAAAECGILNELDDVARRAPQVPSVRAGHVSGAHPDRVGSAKAPVAGAARSRKS